MPADVNWKEYLGYDHDERLGIDLGAVPRFEETILEETADKKVWIDEGGAKRVDFKVDATPGFVTRSYLEFPVKDRASWLEIKKRHNPNSPCRYPEWWETAKRRYQDRDFILSQGCSGLFGRPRGLMGFFGICTAFHDDPDLVQEIIDHTVEFEMQVLDRALTEMEIDYIFYSEDMAYKQHSMISPAMVRKFMLPGYRRMADFFYRHGVKYILVDCDGYLHELIPIWIEAGFNAVWPMEIAAGNDPLWIRRQFGRDIALLGGIDKRELTKDRQAVEAEVMSKVPALLEQGGYVPTVDHAVPPDIAYDNFLYFLELIRKLSEKG